MSSVSPFLKSGTTFAIFKSSGKIPKLKEAFINETRIGIKIEDDTLIK